MPIVDWMSGVIRYIPSAVSITGGTIIGITDLAVADGGTGASTAASARTNLGFGTIATQSATSIAVTGGVIDGATLGLTTPAAAKVTNLEATLGVKVGNVASAVATVLDWYEEGTFTPTMVGNTTAGTATYTVRTGSYQRIGKIVYFTINLAYSGHTGTGAPVINSLPFTPASGVSLSSVNIQTNGFATGTIDKTLQAYIEPSVVGIYFDGRLNLTGVSSAVAIPAAISFLIVTGSYEV